MKEHVTQWYVFNGAPWIHQALIHTQYVLVETFPAGLGHASDTDTAIYEILQLNKHNKKRHWFFPCLVTYLQLSNVKSSQWTDSGGPGPAHMDSFSCWMKFFFGPEQE